MVVTAFRSHSSKCLNINQPHFFISFPLGKNIYNLSNSKRILIAHLKGAVIGCLNSYRNDSQFLRLNDKQFPTANDAMCLAEWKQEQVLFSNVCTKHWLCHVPERNCVQSEKIRRASPTNTGDQNSTCSVFIYPVFRSMKL